MTQDSTQAAAPEGPAADLDRDIEAISRAIRRLRVMIGRRVLSRTAIANVAPSLDLSDLDVLSLVPGRRTGAGPSAGVAVGDIARSLRIHPSRASRLVADLVEEGFLTRAIAQEDGRRTVLSRTARGDAVFAEIQRVKREVIDDIVRDWPEAERATFASGFEAFVAAWEARLDALG